MFLDADILHHNGSFALIWLVGNGQLSESSRIKFEEALVKVRVLPACVRMYKFFTESNAGGTQGGCERIGLKKLSILLNGLAVVHNGQVESLLSSVSFLAVRLHARASDKIDVGRALARLYLEEDVNEDEEILREGLEDVQIQDQDFHILIDEDMQVPEDDERGGAPRISSMFRLQMPPNRPRRRQDPTVEFNRESGVSFDLEEVNGGTEGRKRRRREAGGVIEAVGNGDIYADPTTITMLDMDLPQVNLPDVGFYDDTTGGGPEGQHASFLRAVGMSNADAGVDTSVPLGDHGMGQENDPPPFIEIGASFDRSSLLLDVRNRTAEGLAKDPDASIRIRTPLRGALVLKSLEAETTSPRRRSGLRRGFSRVNEAIQLRGSAYKDLLNYITGGYVVDNEELHRICRDRLPDPRLERNKKGLNFIADVQRGFLGEELKEMVNEVKKRKTENQVEVAYNNIEQMANHEIGLRHRDNRQGNTEILRRRSSRLYNNTTHVSATATMLEEMGTSTTSAAPEIMPRAQPATDIDMTGVRELGEVEITNEETSYVRENENDAIEMIVYNTPPRYAGQTRGQTPRQDYYSIIDENTFADVVPPGQPRLNAVKYFAKLLKKQKKKQVLLTQDEFFGPLTISRIRI